ncbi:acetate uptake transporter [Poriferisphaera sp. WC338]|uniref:acetate uptake transporter n=1 Tax=Poriferisphaera sp. WC338 TaxID=3425129 RepID=UPI003D81B6E3
MSHPTKTGNPAVVGLAGFGLTTLLLQIHNLGYCTLGPVLAMGLIFGGLAQMIAGFQEQKVGNNFGFSAFVSYGAFWIGFGIILILNKIGIYKSETSDVGWFLVVWTGYTAILWLASMRIHKAMFTTFTLLIIGFILLDLGHFNLPIYDKLSIDPAIFNTIACYVLILCALGAWYMMAGIIINDLANKTILPMGTPLISSNPSASTSTQTTSPTPQTTAIPQPNA